MGYELEMADRMTDKDKLTQFSEEVLETTYVALLAARDQIIEELDVSESAALGAVLAATNALKQERFVRE